jgi:cell division protein FtsW (lipid II flippase)
MRNLGVGTAALAINLAATALGFIIWFTGRRLAPPTRPATRALLASVSIVAIALPFAFKGVLGVHRWISVAGLRLHAAAIVAPLLVLCVAAAASHRIASALAIAATAGIILALQPDAAQATSLAVACAVILLCTGTRQPRHALLSAALLVAIAGASFIRPDALPPVAHVEQIFAVVASTGPARAAMATIALLLLPLPFFVAWQRDRRPTAFALGVYVTMTVLAPAWGTFPVPIMGYGASPIVGYFIALVVGVGGPSRASTTGS